MAKSKVLKFRDFDLKSLSVKDDDSSTLKFLMLLEGLFGEGVQHAIKKYGYTEQRYYQLLKDFKRDGVESLIDKKRGPKNNSVRTESVIKQIISYRFLDPDASADVIAQKLKQNGLPIGVRSVERTIKEFGLQKKTLSVKSEAKSKRNKNSTNQANSKKRGSNAANK